MFNAYEVKKENGEIVEKWFVKSLGDDRFTAEVLFDHMEKDWSNGNHLTDLIMIEE